VLNEVIFVFEGCRTSRAARKLADEEPRRIGQRFIELNTTYSLHNSLTISALPSAQVFSFNSPVSRLHSLAI
jgi:hypothetical protein